MCSGLPSDPFILNAVSHSGLAPWVTLALDMPCSLHCTPCGSLTACLVLWGHRHPLQNSAAHNHLFFLNIPPPSLLSPVKILLVSLSPKWPDMASIRSHHSLPWVSTCIVFCDSHISVFCHSSCSCSVTVQHVVFAKHSASSLSLYGLLIQPYEVSVFFTWKMGNGSLERRGDLLYGFVAPMFLKQGCCPRPGAILLALLFLAFLAPRPHVMVILPCKNVSFVSPFKQQDMVSHSSLCFSWLLLCYCVFSGNDCVWSDVCLYVPLYVYIWMDGGWLDG